MRSVVRFLLGYEPRELRDIDPTLTVLDYLRRVEHRIGTKEGCAEGDCGACTVVVARPDGDELRYEAINACIRFVPTLDGCQLLTVEDLKGPDGRLHPVQQAMVDANASQCGFCTPGFVMSLYALYRAGGEPDGATIDDALAGNLCRCTGYGPIIQAARAMRHTAGADAHLTGREAETLATLKAMDDGQGWTVAGDGRSFIAPRDVEQLAAVLLEHPEATVLGGATDVGLWVTKQHRRLELLVWTGRVAELQRLERTPEGLEIGAAVSYADAADALACLAPDASELLRRLGGLQIRNMGTIGGNIANGSPIGDTPPLLIALGASLVLRRGSERRIMPLEEFFIAYGRQDRRPGEFVESVRIPRPAPGRLVRCYKISKRFDQDISAVCAAFSIGLDGGTVSEARIAMGGMAATPKRARAAEAALTGEPWAEAAVAAAAKALARDFQPITDMRATSGYRLRVAQNLLRKCLVESEAPARILQPREPARV